MPAIIIRLLCLCAPVIISVLSLELEIVGISVVTLLAGLVLRLWAGRVERLLWGLRLSLTNI